MRRLLLQAIILLAFSGPCLAEGLVEGLGDESYEKRADSAEKLRRMGLGALPLLKANFHNEDLEIALKSRELYEEYLDIGFDGEYPSIWFLSEEYRFPKGYSVRFNSTLSLCKISCPKDVSKEYYLKAKISLGIPDVDCDCDGGWRLCIVAETAMRMLARDMLLSGSDKKKVSSMVLDTVENQEKNYLVFATENLDAQIWDFWNTSPGVMVGKQDFVFPSY